MNIKQEKYFRITGQKAPSTGTVLLTEEDLKELAEFYQKLAKRTDYIYITDISWDTDGISIDDLPEKVAIQKVDLAYGDEPDVTDEELKDRIADRLSDWYGWCVKSFSVEEAYNSSLEETGLEVDVRKEKAKKNTNEKCYRKYLDLDLELMDDAVRISVLEPESGDKWHCEVPINDMGYKAVSDSLTDEVWSWVKILQSDRDYDKFDASDGRWVLTDEDQYQWCRKVWDGVYELYQLQSVKYNFIPESLNFIAHELINIADIEVDPILECYGYGSLEEIKDRYGESYKQILAECAFEINSGNHENIVDRKPRSWKEGIKIIDKLIGRDPHTVQSLGEGDCDEPK